MGESAPEPKHPAVEAGIPGSLARMKPGAVVVDVAVDQGGCFETTKPTTHSDPVYVLDGVLHYGVSNMPGIVPHTSTVALTNATFPYLLRLASQGVEESVRADSGLAKGVNLSGGKITCREVADAPAAFGPPVPIQPRLPPASRS